jgi:hypothetical protein
VKGEHDYVWTVEDINKANDYREFWWTLNTHFNNTIEIHAEHAVIHGCRHGHMLDVHFALPAPEAYPKPHTLTISQDIGRCSSYKYVGDIEKSARLYMDTNGYYAPEQAVLIRPRFVAKVAGYNGRFLSLMIPRRKDESPATVTRLPSMDHSFVVRIPFATVEDTLIWAYEHNLLEANGVKAHGQWVVVRRSLRTGRLLRYRIGHGTSLAVDGKAVHLPR